MKIYDSHVHSKNSHDGKASVDDICTRAKAMGFCGITITDHFDCERYASKEDCRHISKSLSEIENAQKNFDGFLEVYKGVELADTIYNPSMGDICFSLGEFDFVLASLHSTSTGKRVKNGFKSFKDFAHTTPDEDRAFLDLYYKNLILAAQYGDFDALAHLTYPARYLNGVNRKQISLDDYMPQLEKILKILIEREKALEINTSGLKTDWNTTMPNQSLIELYYSMGGRLITAGSDAHVPEHLGCGFERLFTMLKDIGFDEYYFYKKRRPVPVSL